MQCEDDHASKRTLPRAHRSTGVGAADVRIDMNAGYDVYETIIATFGTPEAHTPQ
jgi:hypothetical protein